MSIQPEQSLKKIQEAAQRLEGVIRRVPLIHSATFGGLVGTEVWLKPENLQQTGTYKIRGAYNKIAQLSDAEKERGLIASSAGNHAQGVAYAAQKAGVAATVVMPETAPLIKRQATEAYGANVILYGNFYDEAQAEAYRLEETYNLTFIHPFNDIDIIYGQGTVGLEILAEMPDVKNIIVPIGGGGLASGIALAVKAIKPEVRIIGVEPDGADAMLKSVKSGKLTALSEVRTIADGVAVAEPKQLTFDIIREYVDDIICVSDDHIMEAFLLLLEKHKLVAEPAGAVALAALMHNNVKLDGLTVPIISGGNIDVVTMSALIQRGLVKLGRIFEFAVDLPDRPGQLLNIARILAEQSANTIQIEHNQFQNIERFTHVRLKVKVETNGHDHIQDVVNALAEEGYPLVEEFNGNV